MNNYCQEPQAHPERCGCKPDAFQIARHSKRLVEQQRERIAALEAECERLRQFQIAYNDWQAKTDWVQESAKPNELGRHRADVLRARIEALAAELAAIKGQEPVGVVHLRKGGGISMLQVELNTPLHPGTKLYTLPAELVGGGEV